MGKQTANIGKTSNITLLENKCGKLRGFGGWPPINNNNFAANDDFRFSAVRIPAISGLLYHFKRYLHQTGEERQYGNLILVKGVVL